jgi:hypothetical protein
MMLSKRIWVAISGIVWLGIGVMLLVKGLRYLVPVIGEGKAPLVEMLLTFASSRQQAMLMIICLSLLVGFVKGRTVLAKSVGRMVERMQGDKLAFAQVFDKRYGLILGLMMGLGFTLRALHLPHDIHGAIDVAIGSALITGSMLYFRKLVVPC